MKSQRIRSFAIAALLAALLAPPAVRAESPSRHVAVIPFSNATGEAEYESLREGLADLMATQMGRVEGVTVVERVEIEKILKEQEISLTGQVKDDQAITVGRLLGAGLILTGTYARNGESLTISGHLYDVETTRLVRSEEADGKMGGILETVEDLLVKLTEDLDLKITGLQPQEIDESPVANLHFMRGLGHYHAGMYDHAIVEFLNTLRLAPGNAGARYWMARSHGALEEWGHAAVELNVLFNDKSAREQYGQAVELLREAMEKLSEEERETIEALRKNR